MRSVLVSKVQLLSINEGSFYCVILNITHLRNDMSEDRLNFDQMEFLVGQRLDVW